jgi:hypothetical protein
MRVQFASTLKSFTLAQRAHLTEQQHLRILQGLLALIRGEVALVEDGVDAHATTGHPPSPQATPNQVLLCAHLHAIFLQHPRLVHQLHMQGYDRALIPVLLEQVESLHILLDVLPELMGKVELADVLFGVEVAVRYLERYPLERG